MKKTPAPQAVSRNELARVYDVNHGTVDAWVKRGCPQLESGKFDRAAVKEWLKTQKEQKAATMDKREQKLDAEIARIQKQCRQQDLDYSRASEAVHPRDQCCASLSRVISDHLAPLLNVGSRLATQFPELGKRLKDAADSEIDAAFNAIREGLPQ